MQHPRRVQPRALLGLIVLLIVSWTADLRANLSGNSLAEFTSYPLTADVTRHAHPQVLFALSVDHQLWFEAYDDHSDLDGDGVVEATYTDDFDYYGYFHSGRCYRYVDATARFIVAGPSDGPHQHYCSGALADAWSGNFLNWATMTRLDVLRKMLYGGRRSIDTADTTVLERAGLPHDGHSFAKYYNGGDLALLTPFDALRTDSSNGGDGDGIDDAGEGITLCSTTHAASGASSQATTAPPLLRVAAANHQLWAANERWQCTWEDEAGDNGNGNQALLSGIFAALSDPTNAAALRTPGGARDHVVQVESCAAAFHAGEDNPEQCVAYPSGHLKPTGVLQEFGLGAGMHFGLLSGSYAGNLSGGVLRREIGDIGNEIDRESGRFNAAPANGSIIANLDLLRIYGYGYTDGTYLASSGGGDNCSFQLATITQGNCASWGNPFSEIYAEALRYFALASSRGPSAAFNGNDAPYIAGLTRGRWFPDPFELNIGVCRPPAIVGINSGVASYDRDGTVVPMSPSGVDPVALTDTVGDAEGLAGVPLFVGNSGSVADRLCTPKAAGGLGAVAGLCPGGATLDSSMHAAGLAWHAHTQDLRYDFPGEQRIDTLTLQLGRAQPSIDLTLPNGGLIRITPEHRLLSANRGGSLTAFRIARRLTEVNPAEVAGGRPTPPAGSVFPAAQSGSGVFHAKYFLAWDDSEQGADFDLDLWGTIDTVLDTSVIPARLTVTTTAVAEGTVGGQLFGFTVEGTTQDGFHAYSGIEGAQYTDPSGVPGCIGCRALSESGGQRGAQSHTFVAGQSDGRFPASPLFYAAKWGGFDDIDGDGRPSERAEWDVRDASGDLTEDRDGDGIADGDGVPDNYFAREPGALARGLRAELQRRVGALDAVQVLAAEQRAGDLFVQTSYWPYAGDDTLARNEASWVGTALGLFVDQGGDALLREDANQNGTLDGYDVDKVVAMVFDVADRRWKFRRYASASAATFEPLDTTPALLELSALRPLWNARTRLSDLHPDTIHEQRVYSAPSGPGPGAGRHILTWRDDDFDRTVRADGSELVAFTRASFAAAAHARWLDEADPARAMRVVDWVRGREFPDLRARVLDHDADNVGASAVHASGNPEVMRLGDSSNARPVIVGSPRATYDQENGDSSYTAYRERWQGRRHVVYLGANDGMLHAFNAGFHDAANKRYLLTREGEPAHALGAEIWAYVPQPLLPQLQWLTRPDYTHVAYADQSAQAFDVRAFTPDADHPGGWGTLLVAGIGPGGDADGTALDIDADGTADADLRSSYVILDVTNPERPPRLLAELSPPGLGYSTSLPMVFPVADADGSARRWYLALGSGPTNRRSLDSDQNATLFIYDIRALTEPAGAAAVEPVVAYPLPLTGPPGSYVGDIAAADYTGDMRTDALYFGRINEGSFRGALYRLAIAGLADSNQWGTPFVLLGNVNRAFVERPTFARDSAQRAWIVAGAGRVLTVHDSAPGEEMIYGFIDPNPPDDADSALIVDGNMLVDTSRSFVGTDGEVRGEIDSDLAFLTGAIVNAGGWKRNYGTTADGTGYRTAAGAHLVGNQILQVAAARDETSCLAGEALHHSRLFALDFSTGLASLQNTLLGTEPCQGCPTGVLAPRTSIDLEPGLQRTPPPSLLAAVTPPPEVVNGTQIALMPPLWLALLAVLLGALGLRRRAPG